MIASSSHVAPSATLRSPPRNWPASFKENTKLVAFLHKNIKARKARLVCRPSAELSALVSCAGPFEQDFVANATRVHAQLGWPTLSGFIIYEAEDCPDTFVAKAHAWNLRDGAWVDVTPRASGLTDVLLVEADHEPTLAALRSPHVSLTIDLSDIVAAAPAPTPAAVAIESEPAEALPEVPSAEAPKSYDEILASISLGPKASGKQPAKRERKPFDPDKVVSSYTVEGSEKGKWVGATGKETLQKTRWPPKSSNVRLRVRADGRFELEATCWGTAREQDDEFIAYGCGRGAWFRPLEAIDPDAAQLRVTGEMPPTGREVLTVHTVEELRNANQRRPPITEDDIYGVCGRTLCNALNLFRSKRVLTITLDRNTEWNLQLREDVDDGWASDDAED